MQNGASRSRFDTDGDGYRLAVKKLIRVRQENKGRRCKEKIFSTHHLISPAYRQAGMLLMKVLKRASLLMNEAFILTLNRRQP